MSVKRSPAARVIEFFTAAPLGEAELVLGLVKDLVKKRYITLKPGPPYVVSKPRARRKVNAKAPVPVSDTATPRPVAEA